MLVADEEPLSDLNQVSAGGEYGRRRGGYRCTVRVCGHAGRREQRGEYKYIQGDAGHDMGVGGAQVTADNQVCNV